MIELIIFDCDGVLIDSKIIAKRIESEELARFGCTITSEEIMDRFMGSIDNWKLPHPTNHSPLPGSSVMDRERRCIRTRCVFSSFGS